MNVAAIPITGFGYVYEDDPAELIEVIARKNSQSDLYSFRHLKRLADKIGADVVSVWFYNMYDKWYIDYHERSGKLLLRFMLDREDVWEVKVDGDRIWYNKHFLRDD